MAQISPSHPNPTHTHTHVRAWHDLLIYTSIMPVSHTYPIFCYIPDALFRASFIFQSRGIWSWLWNNTSSYHKIASIFQQCVLTIQFHNSFTSKLDHPPMSASWIKQRVSRCFEFDVVKLMSQIRTAVTIVTLYTTSISWKVSEFFFVAQLGGKLPTRSDRKKLKNWWASKQVQQTFLNFLAITCRGH